VQAAVRGWKRLNPNVWNGAGPDSNLTVNRKFKVWFRGVVNEALPGELICFTMLLVVAETLTAFKPNSTRCILSDTGLRMWCLSSFVLKNSQTCF